MNSTQLTTQQKVDTFKLSLMNKHKTELMNYFTNNEDNMKKFMSAVVYSINKNVKLLDNIPSLIDATLELAQTWLMPWPTQEAYIVPYKGRATWMIWYQGWIRLLNQAGFKRIFWEIVYENDIFEYELGTNPKIIHKVNPKLSKKARWKAIGCYVVIDSNSKYMNIEDIYEYRDEYSQSRKDKEKRKYSPWDEKNDPEMNMAKKTVLKQLIKWAKEEWTLIPQNEKIWKAIEIDNNEAPVIGWEFTTWANQDNLDPNNNANA